ncbi:hypothetical protein EVAR_46339_1 [Eumeta japonica]|uniref:Uncharacterized protein n=1 Tax=Eumeta variegata TaxID=151549 RepID=A0A4C1WVV4_EUMVA|nr:hypothetical protein EVAR_46339_1 [Eumeta japonica]
MNIFHWADLRKVPAWEDIQKALDVLIQTGYIHCNKDTEVFDEFTLISRRPRGRRTAARASPASRRLAPAAARVSRRALRRDIADRHVSASCFSRAFFARFLIARVN